MLAIMDASIQNAPDRNCITLQSCATGVKAGRPVIESGRHQRTARGRSIS